MVIDNQYGDGSFVVGDLSKDQVSIGDTKSLAANAYFVLATKDNLTAVDKGDLPDGILGLGFRELSDGYDTLVDSLAQQGVIKKRVFALYLNRLGEIGGQSGYGSKPSSLEIGSYDINKYSHSSHLIVTQDIYPNLGFWFAQVNFELMDLKIKHVPVIYDSGTTLIVVDTMTYANIYNYVAESNTCLEYGLIFCQCDSADDMPDLLFYVDDHKLRIPSDRAWYYEEETCVLLVQPSDNNFWILGAVFLQNFYTIHDMDKHQITFASLHSSYAAIISIVSLFIIC